MKHIRHRDTGWAVLSRSAVKLELHDTDTDIVADILTRIVARMSVSVSWNASLMAYTAKLSVSRKRCKVETLIVSVDN